MRTWPLNATALLGLALITSLGCSQAAATSPSATGTPSRSMSSPSTAPSAIEKTYTDSDLPAIILSPGQMAGWQTATRLDLTGPFTSTTNTNPQERPAPVAGVRAGYRQTIGHPGASGPNTVRTILELFDTSTIAKTVLTGTVQGYEDVGYMQVVDSSPLGLGPEAIARSGSNVPVAPQFAQGSVQQGLVVIWRSGNLLLIQISGGDNEVTIDAASRWVGTVNSNAKGLGV